LQGGQLMERTAKRDLKLQSDQIMFVLRENSCVNCSQPLFSQYCQCDPFTVV
jgi:hypothetical protein